MRKLYYFLLTMVLGLVSMAAKADDITVTVNVDDASHVKVYTYAYDANYNPVETEHTFTDNVCTLTVPSYSNIKIKTAAGYLFKKVENNGIEEPYSVNKTEYGIYPSANTTINIETVSEDELYTASFKLNVDDPYAVRVAMAGTYREISLVAGENIVKYNPQTETSVQIGSNGSKPLYQVLKGETVVEYQRGYTIELPTEEVITVKAAFPADLTYNIKFTFADEDSKGFISAVQVNYQNIEDFASADGFNVPAGANVSFTGDNTNYALDSFTLNGQNEYFGYGNYSFYATADAEYGVKAHKFGTVKVTVNIDDPANVTVYRGYEYNNDIVTGIVAGDNVIEMSENANKVITIKANDQCFLSSVNDGTNDLNIYSGKCDVTFTDGMTITVKSGKIVRDKEATVNVHDRALADYSFSFVSQNDRNLTFNLSEGENTINFCDTDVPFSFSCYGSTIQNQHMVFLDGYLLHPRYGNESITPVDGSVIDIYLGEPEVEGASTVKFVFGDNVDATKISKVTFPGGEAYEWDKKGITAIGKNYQVVITPAEGASIGVKADDLTIEQNAEGNFVVNVTPLTTEINVFSTATEEDPNIVSFPLYIDDATAVRVMFDGTWRNATVVNGENTISYNKETEKGLIILRNTEKPLYKVTNRGEEVAARGSQYTIDLTAATPDISITAAWPADITYKVSFAFADEDSKGFITGVTVDGVDVENFAAEEGFEVAGGAKVTVSADNTNYALDSFKVNDSNENFGYGTYVFYATADNAISIKAHKYATFNVTVNVDDPTNVTVYNGYSYENKVVELQAGDNTVELSENGNKTITIVANDQCFISSVNNGTDDIAVYGGQCSVSVSEGMTLTVKTGRIIRDKKATVFVTGRDLASSYFNLYSNANSMYKFENLVEGENEIAFCDNDLTFNFGCYGPSINQQHKVYVDGILAEQYNGQYALNFNDGSVVNIFLGTNDFESTKTTTFTFQEGQTAASIAAVASTAGPSNTWAESGIISAADQQVVLTVTPAADANIGIIVDDKQVKANEDGIFVITVSPSTTEIIVTTAEAVGVSSVNAAKSAAATSYMLQGIKVNSRTYNGLQIINGKKVLNRK